LDPWLRGPKEILDQAIIHFRNQSSRDDRFAMLHTDNAVELLVRTYLVRKKRALRRHELATMRFPDIIRILQESAPNQISADEAERILFFHDIRNLLYHETDVLSVRREDVENYLSAAILLFKKLFDVGVDFPIESISDTRLILESENSLQYYRKILGADRVTDLSEHIFFPMQ
jgi:hypothetical protein